ncbi:hypothetical protein [Cohaesibacter haloalkalitolerans]|nr:hypothetical protein [Cohaesibacter haloalkalitolerans]
MSRGLAKKRIDQPQSPSCTAVANMRFTVVNPAIAKRLPERG